MIKNTLSINVVFLCIYFLSTPLTAQDNLIFNGSKHKVGFIGGYGNQAFLNVKYDYRTVYLQVQYYYTFVRNEKWSFETLIQPQYNITEYRRIDNIPETTDGFEFGVNVALLLRRSLFKDRVNIYGFIGAGPHYVSGTPERQADKFIFSTKFFGGANIKINDKWYLDLRPGVKHISNASLKKPNGGVNDFVMSAGFFYVL